MLAPKLREPPLAPVNVAPFELSGATMGTTWRLRAFAPPGFNAKRLETEIAAVLAAVVDEMSPWEAHSALSRFNALAAGETLPAPLHMRCVLEDALHVAGETDGAFDPTLGVLVDLWGFGARAPAQDKPREDDISAALAHAGWRKLTFEDDALHQPGGLRLDLNGIAKGYAVDAAAEVAAAAGLTSYLMEIGGELRAAGIKPDGQPWWVELQQPPGGAGERLLLALYNETVATSGDYIRHDIVDGEEIAHTISPFTGKPLRNGVASVSVLHASCMRADAYATALSVMGVEAGLAFAARADIAAVITARREGALTEHFSPRAAAMLED